MIQKISIVKGNRIISSDKDAAEALNTFYKDAVDSLNIQVNTYILNFVDRNVDCIIEEFTSHPCILKVNEMVDSICTAFSFMEVDIKYIQREITKIDPKKAITFKHIPTKVIKDVNYSINNSVFPNKLKVEDISPILRGMLLQM